MNRLDRRMLKTHAFQQVVRHSTIELDRDDWIGHLLFLRYFLRGQSSSGQFGDILAAGFHLDKHDCLLPRLRLFSELRLSSGSDAETVLFVRFAT